MALPLLGLGSGRNSRMKALRRMFGLPGLTWSAGFTLAFALATACGGDDNNVTGGSAGQGGQRGSGGNKRPLAAGAGTGGASPGSPRCGDPLALFPSGPVVAVGGSDVAP